MKNKINYTDLIIDNYSFLTPFIKSSKLKRKNIDTIILDSDGYYNNVEYLYKELHNIKNVIIDKKSLLKKSSLIHRNVEIYNTKAENIFIKSENNLGGLTFPTDSFDYDLFLEWTDDKVCNIKEINIVFKNKVEKIRLNKEVNKISILPQKVKDKINKVIVYVENKKYSKRYEIDSTLGLVDEKYNKYTFTKSDLKNGVLDLTNIDYYKDFSGDNIDVDTLIITKEILFSNKFYSVFDDKLNIKRLVIIDKNEMKLYPETTIQFNGILNIYSNFIVNDDKTIFIYMDKKELKIIDKNKLLEAEEIDDVKYIENSDCELILIKYKNNNFKIIDENGEYIIDELFGDFLYLNLYSYDFYKEEIPYLTHFILNKEWDKPFINKIIDNNIFICIYGDYLEFIERIKELKELGFKDETIKYLIRRKYDNLINTKSKNILDIKEIGEHEVKLFNYMSEIEIFNKVLTKKKKK